MRIINDLRTVRLDQPTVLTIGNFDGIHRGHQALLQRVQEIAATNVPPAASALLTFDPHPLLVLRPDREHKLLTTPQDRLLLAQALGIHVGVIQPFTLELASLTPHQFMQLVKSHLDIATLVVGPDFALGRNRAGDIDTLRQIGKELDYQLAIIEPVEWQGRSVSSSNIRELLADGDVATVADLLGRAYSLTGVVEEGDGRGRQLGIPTANMRIRSELLWPADGVYATRTWLIHEGTACAFNSVTNLGFRPTVDGSRRQCETHILDFPPQGWDGNLYQKVITVEFIQHLRSERRFAGIDELVAQIHTDIAAARRLFTGSGSTISTTPPVSMTTDPA